MEKEQIKVTKVTSGDISKIYRDVKALMAKKDGCATAESIADRIIEVYRYAGAIGIRENCYTDEAKTASDRELMISDIAYCPAEVLKVLDKLELDFMDHEKDEEQEVLRQEYYAQTGNEQPKAVTSTMVCRLCDDIEAFVAKKNPSITAESLTDRIIEAYKYAEETGISGGPCDSKDEAESRAAILEDLREHPKRVLVNVETLGMDYFYYEMEEREKENLAAVRTA